MNHFFNKLLGQLQTREAKLKTADYKGQIAAISKVMGVIEFSLDGKIIAVNDNFAAVTGYSAIELIGQHHSMFVAPDERISNEYRLFWERLSRGEFDQGQFKRIAKGGREIWLEASYNPIFDADGKPIKVVKYATNITQAKLQASDFSGQLSAISKAQGVIEFNLDGIILKVNDNFSALTGYRIDEMVGRHQSMFVSSEEKNSPQYKAFWDKLSRGEFDQGQYKRINKKGESIWLEASYNPIFDMNGKAYKVVKYARDITANVKLAESARVLSMVANETDNSVLITDADGLIEYVNEGFYKLTGYKSEEVIGKKPGTLLQGKLTSAETIKHIGEKLRAKQPFYEEILNYNKNGESYWISLAINPVFDDKHQLTNFISIQTNITETKLRSIEFNARLEAISRTSGIVEFTPNGKIVYANDNFCNIVGYSLAEIKNQHHQIFVEQIEKNSPEYQLFWDKLSRGEHVSGQFKRLSKNGDIVWLQGSYSPIYDQNGQVTKVVKFAHDVTGQINAAKSLETAVKEIQLVVEASKTSDLTLRVDLEGKTGPIASLCSGVNALMDKMSEVILHIREAGETISIAASEISSGNNDLSNRTEQQASSLQETSSSMTQLATTVKQNAENAKQANLLAAAASGVAVKGGNVVNQVVVTMADINQRSRKIEDIIAVIDGIAFQTNILALNAAVEAARAGEQGRGFAVVAGEVRNLAQRSASAAKEIKQLIADSVDKVQEGTKLVEDAGNTMQEIVQSVQRVTDIMSEISTASIEQSIGIDKVNHSIANIDEVTQQNTALVEEAAAASELLVTQSLSLVDTVSEFRLENSANHTTSHANRNNGLRSVKSSIKPTSKSNSIAASSSKSSTKLAAFSAASNRDFTPKNHAKTGTDNENWAEF